MLQANPEINRNFAQKWDDNALVHPKQSRQQAKTAEKFKLCLNGT